MTTITTARPRKAAIRGGRQVAERILASRQLPPGADAGQLAAAFGKALAITSPQSAHGKVLAGALRDKQSQDRTPAERAAWWLAIRGQTPTEAAVAKRLAELDSQRRRAVEHKKAADLRANRDGLRAARYVAMALTCTGAGPTWRELSRAMGWPDASCAAVIRRLVDAGWLAAGEERRSLRPGARYAGQP